MATEGKPLVNPIALKGCTARIGDLESPILDVSFVRLVVEAGEGWDSLPEGEALPVTLQLDRIQVPALAEVSARGEDWIRLSFESIKPSARAHMRAFLSPKKVGESIVEDWNTETLRHFHGLNESELWFEPEGAVLFTYLDSLDTDAQFLIRMAHTKGPLMAGKILRSDYINLNTIDGELSLIPLSDGEIYQKLGECRDIVTNFRPTAHLEYNLKQRLLKVISEYLYSTSRKVELAKMTNARSLSLS